MKRCLALLLPALLVVPAIGQTPEGETVSEIFSDMSAYDQKASTLHYWGNVHLVSPGTLDLRCDDFLINLGAGESKLDQIVASTNVVLRLVQTASATQPAMTNVAYAHQAIFNGASNLVTLVKSPAGVQPRFEASDIVAEADEIVYNRATDRFELKGNHRTRFKPGKLPKGGFFAPKTNAAPTVR